jgi:GR25 family glycosyltransferase involved in LPS biosynthesis
MVLQDIRVHPTYVINLDRRPDRWQTFQAQSALQEFKQLQRFSAVDGKTLNIFSDERISLHTRHNIQANYRRSDYEINTAGAIGASFSHITLWEDFLQGDSEFLVVFEDDTIVDAKTLAFIDTLIPTLPEQWDMWLLGTHAWNLTAKPLVKSQPKGWKHVKVFTGAHAYVLSRQGAKILLENPYPIETHIEYYICGCAEFKGLKLITHSMLRMTYGTEVNEIADSDTFLSRKSCPTCRIPDHYHKYGLYFSYEQLVAAYALSFAVFGIWLNWKK